MLYDCGDWRVVGDLRHSIFASSLLRLLFRRQMSSISRALMSFKSLSELSA